MFGKRKRSQRDFAEELEAHLAMEADRLREAGMSEDEARAEARRNLGNIAGIQERFYEAHRWLWLDHLVQDLRFGLRQLRRNPGFTIVAVLTLALGIGATTALFTIVRSVLLRPLPFKAPGRLVALYEQSPDGKLPYGFVAAGVFAEWKKQSTDFSGLAILRPWGQYDLSGAGGELPETIHAAEVSWTLFPTLGVAPALGRGFTVEDDRPSTNGTAILSWGLWKRRFGGEKSIIGQTINLDEQAYTVIGVMPAWFAYPNSSAQLWTPVYHEMMPGEAQAIDMHDFTAVGRLKRGVAAQQATAQLSVIVRRLHNEHLNDPFISIAANSRPLMEAIVGDVKTPLYAMLAATGCLLLIACLNVTGLLVARGATRRREMAIRSALGGGRRRLLAQHLTESLLLSATGGAVGLFIADALVKWFVAAQPDMSRVETIHLDLWAAAFVILLIFGCALFACFASSPSSEGRGRMMAALRESSRSQIAGHGRARLRKTLLTLEVGLTVILLVGAGLLLRSYQRLRSADLGCITKNVLTMGISLPQTKYTRTVQITSFFKTLLADARALPGVQAAGLVRLVPGQGYGGDHGFRIVEHPPLPLGKGEHAIVSWADPGYFTAIGIPFLRGGTFDPEQMLKETPEVIINRSFAQQYFPGEDPIGKHLIAIRKRPFTIVGVVGDTRFAAAQAPQPMMYFPMDKPLFGDTPPPSATLAVRSRQNVTSLALPLQHIVQHLDPQLAVSNILTMNQLIGKSTVDASFDATLMLAFALLSLALAAVGLFGVVSYMVNQRTHEIGIRMALGAQKSDVLRMVIRQGIAPALAGLAIGIAGAFGLTRFLSSLLYGVKPTDPVTFIVVSTILIAVALLACYIPALRAAKVDPLVALRDE